MSLGLNTTGKEKNYEVHSFLLKTGSHLKVMGVNKGPPINRKAYNTHLKVYYEAWEYNPV